MVKEIESKQIILKTWAASHTEAVSPVAISPSNIAILSLMNKTDSFVQDLSHWSNVISNVAISQKYITEQYDMRIAQWYIAVDKRDFCSQVIDFMQLGVCFKVVAIVGIANWLRFTISGI